MSTILSGVTTIIIPISTVPTLVSTSISGGNTVISGGYAQFNSAYYANKSFDVMEAGILAERQLLRAQIRARVCETFRYLRQHGGRKKLAEDEDNAFGPEAQQKVRYHGVGAVPTPTPTAGTETSDPCAIPKTDKYSGYNPTPYFDMADAMSDLIQYDRVCSIEGGLKELSQEAARKQEQADAASGLGAPTATPTATATKAPPAAQDAAGGAGKPPTSPRGNAGGRRKGTHRAG